MAVAKREQQQPSGSGVAEGICTIDKPGGMTSHDVVNQVRRACRTRRVGHAGTLDPLATGVLVVGVGRATRLIEYIVGMPKEYESVVRLGQTTDTYDADGDVTSEHPVDVSDAALEAALARFRGTIEQVPPMYSAIKRAGQPLYKLARAGIEVERQSRTVTITELSVVVRSEADITLRVGCSTGTYIRSLAHDLGAVLGCGAHVRALRRTRVGPFSAETALPLSAVSPAHLLRLDSAVAHLSRLDVTAAEAIDLAHGRRIARDAAAEADIARVYDATGRFTGIVRAAGDQWQPHKIFHQLL